MGKAKQKDEESESEVVAFVNQDLINDFVESYKPGGKNNFDCCFTRPMLRDIFGIYAEINSVDALPSYITALSCKGFKEVLGFCGEPCIFVKEIAIPDAVCVDDDLD